MSPGQATLRSGQSPAGGSRALSEPAQSARAERDRRLLALDFDRAPFTIAWEVTRACAYNCLHCRADAQPRRDPRELSTVEGMALIDQLAGFGTQPILVLTGGDPLMRRDLFRLAAHADERGLRVALTPTATALVTRARMREAREAGIRRVAFSVDGPTAGVHDRFRGFAGSFLRTMEGIAAARAEGLALQVNTTVCALNVEVIAELVPLLEAWEVVQWSVFFLVPTGRGAILPMLSAAEHERVLGWLYELSRVVPFDIKTTAAPQYRRIAIERSGRRHGAAPGGAGYLFGDGLHRPPKGVTDGRGFMFISHRGEVMPSGFLQLSAGNVRERDPVDIYRRSALFCALRNPDALRGKCGRCELRELCGGSRARAWALTGDPLASDPSCSYVPAALRAQS
ncbi:MAG TPA: TIGR04053 family radical SAM/SPASM domain-containing protein [Solirubrobacteraceae bacterium]|nr:TIGR04053 family radical SAM/SPASM domain-containing protein [Solirubrobacteraceae bacterium]